MFTKIEVCFEVEGNMMEAKFMKEAIRLAVENVLKFGGKPFGAVLVKDGEIIARAVNEVEREFDPTAHAELLTIKDACKQLKTLDLSDCVLYASGQPCPMCLSAIYWANIKEVYFAYSLSDAGKVGLSSEYIYNQISAEHKEISFRQFHVDSENPLNIWYEKQI